jgi:predicted nuclease of predicted toxin-antitoxin system
LKILLDENFPLQLYRRLRAAGHDAEHIIVLELRGTPDTVIQERLVREPILFVTSDTEFSDAVIHAGGLTAISRVPQSRPISERVDLWSRAIEALLRQHVRGRVFEILETGDFVDFDVRH